MIALLGQGRVIDDQPGVRTPDHFVRFGHQHRFELRGVPHSAIDEMMKLVVVHAAVTRRHRLHALAIPRPDQPRNIARAHPRSRLVPKRC